MNPSTSPIDLFSGKYAFLSNFHFVSIVYEGEKYSTVEHAFQAAKTNNPKLRKRIANTLRPGQAKRLGRAIPVLEFRPDWDEERLSVMEEIVRLKFQHPGLATQLIKTNNRTLIEGNYWGDRFWGACTTRDKNHHRIWDGKKFLWYGENHLGIILMGIREELNG